MKDELKREIRTIAHSGFQRDYMSSCECDYDADKVADSIISLLTPTIEKAEKTQQELKIVKRWLHFFMDDVKPELKEMLTKAILSDIQHPDPAIEKAEKWDKVSSLISGDCNSCPAFIYCTNNSIHPCEILKDALEGGQGDKS